MKIILLCGNAPNQITLANKLAKEVELCGIICENKSFVKRKWTIKNIAEIIAGQIIFRKIHNTWHRLMNFYRKNYPDFPQTKILQVNDINDKEVVNFIREEKPDLVAVSGTSIIKGKIFELKIPKGIINLHTGLSPYIKGGPNCTNWCLATGSFHMIGNTVMWLDKGIDSGNIITTETTSLTGKENFFEIHLKVMEHAHDLYIRAIKAVEKDISKCSNKKQKEIAEGKLYLSKMWNYKQKKKLLKNLKKYNPTSLNVDKKPNTVPLEEND